jgi:phenylpropionate dioxygenase-like ring-hydroxylating dioxygenase large terminal subunit
MKTKDCPGNNVESTIDQPQDTASEGEHAPPAPQNGAIDNWVPHAIVMRDAWFPVAYSHAVRGKPIRRTVYSHPYFLWRENGAAIACEFHPNERPNRPTSEFTDGGGRYPVMEQYGYVWAWLGNPGAADPVHLPSLPFLPPKGGLPGYMLGTNRFDCAAPIALENLIDLTHADFLHSNLIGDQKSQSETAEVLNTSETVTMVRTCIGKSVAPIMKFFSGVRQPTQNIRQVIHIYLRSHCAIAYGYFSPGDDVPLFHPCLPETRDRSRMDFSMNTSNAGFMFRHLMPKASYLISRQDSSMTSAQSPRYMRETKRRDLHSKFDVAGQRYRSLMQNLVARQAAGDFAYRDNVSTDCSDLIGMRKEQFRF